MANAAEKMDPPSVLDLFKEHERFCKCMLDAYVVVDMEGRVRKCNPLFSQLVGIRTRQILKSDSLDELLAFTVGARTLGVADLLAYDTPTRIDEVNGRSNDKENLNLILGLYPFIHEGTKLGSFILIRDVTAETNLQDKYKDKATQSITDPLTGLFNRAHLVDYMANQISTLETFPADAAQRQMSIIILDIDYFKKVNDVYGHQAGDDVLKNVADIMKKTFRKTDVICRYGGEEFLAILPGTESEGACIAAEKLRAAIEGFTFDFEGTQIPVTVSSGVAQVVLGQENADQAIARADQALYASKENGRNQVTYHNGDALCAPPSPKGPAPSNGGGSSPAGSEEPSES